jgi:5-methyltetrahydrofolate--homocysteine methyltransferase
VNAIAASPHAPPAPAETPAQTPFDRERRIALLEPLLKQRILVIDGAMGTVMQGHRLTEEDYRGERFRDHPRDLRGDHDLLALTRPDVVTEAHRAYLTAGADIIETNTFTATRISQADYGMVEVVAEINETAARLARAVADEFEAAEPLRPRFVAGSLGPTNRTASLSVEVMDPGKRGVRFVELAEAYEEAATALVAGGADLLIVETIFDTLNAKAAIYGIESLFERLGHRLPVIISGTVVDASGRTLSGQTVEAFWYSVAHARPLAVGLNCALGARQMRGWLDELGGVG